LRGDALEDSEMTRRRSITIGTGVLGAVLLAAAPSRADIPAGYKGTPFMGTPWPIPGRIDFENYDDGGMGVGWRVDDHTGNFGVGGCPGNSYRTELPHPQLCQTNTNQGENDIYSAGPKMGTHYPSDAMPKSIYIGYTHGVDWVKVTVNVAKAGMYKLSSVWGSEPGGATGIHFQVLFNDVMKADVTLPGTGGYHNWVESPDFATVQLDAGVQVMQFNAKSQHLNYDYIQFSLVTPNGVDPSGAAGTGGGAAGTGGAAGAGAAGTTGAAGATAGAAGTTGAAGTSGAAGGPPTGAAGEGTTTGAAGETGGTGAAGVTGSGTGAAGEASGTGAAGMGAATGAAGVTGSGTGAAGTGTHVNRNSSSGGCSVAGARQAGAMTVLLVAVGIVLGLTRRRRRR
jgi:hypothetical protein